MSGLLILILAIAFMALFVLVFRSPAPAIDRLLLFVLLLVVAGLLAYAMAVRLLGYNPDPDRLRLARAITENKIIDLTQIVPGLPPDLDYIYRLDTDGDDERIEDENVAREWLVVYRYDAVLRDERVVAGPFGAAIYDTGRCRPPSIFSFELVPVDYDYIGQDGVLVTVEEIIPYADERSDPLGLGVNRPEIILAGLTSGTVTDLNIFRKVGFYTDCEATRQVHADPLAETITLPFKYQVIGTFRGTYQVERDGSTVVVKDRAGFERSQIVVRRVYMPDPDTGSYLVPVIAVSEGEERLTYRLRPPYEEGLAFGPGRPERTREVYYPEKTVLAFFLDLGSNTDRAMGYTCQGKGEADYQPENFGLELPERQLGRVIVCELSYVPNDEAERNHTTRTVKVKVVEEPEGEHRTCSQTRSLTCIVNSSPNPDALPYGCEWCLYGCTWAP